MERSDSGLLKQPLLKGHGHMMVCNRAGRRLLEQVTNIFHISKKYIQYIYDKYCSYFQQQERKVRVTCNREKGLRVQEQVTGQDRPSISSNDPGSVRCPENGFLRATLITYLLLQ